MKTRKEVIIDKQEVISDRQEVISDSQDTMSVIVEKEEDISFSHFTICDDRIIMAKNGSLIASYHPFTPDDNLI